MNSSRFILIIGLSLLTSCAVTKNDYENDAQVKSFWTKFNKTDFIQGINAKRINAEEYVIKINNKNLQNDNIVTLYNSTELAYNNIIDKMIIDINSIDNILDMSFLNANNKYAAELADSEEKEFKFIKEANELLNPNSESSFMGGIFNKLISIIPGGQLIQNIYLNYLKQDLINKLNNTKWRAWENIH